MSAVQRNVRDDGVTIDHLAVDVDVEVRKRVVPLPEQRLDVPATGDRLVRPRPPDADLDVLGVQVVDNVDVPTLEQFGDLVADQFLGSEVLYL